MIRRRTAIAVFAVLVAAVSSVGVLTALDQPKSYSSHCQVLIVKKSPLATAAQSKSFEEDYMATQAVLLKSQVIAQRAAESPKMKKRLATVGFRSFPDAKKPDDLTGQLMAGLEVRRPQDSPPNGNVLDLKFTCGDREECKWCLEAIIEAHQSYLDDVYKDIGDTIFRDVQRQFEECEKRVGRAEHDYMEFVKNAPPMTLSNESVAFSKQINIITDRFAENAARMQLLRAQLEAANKAEGNKDLADGLKLHAAVWAKKAGLEANLGTVENYLKALRYELHEAETTYSALTAGLSKLAEESRTMAKFEAQDERLRHSRDRSIAMLDDMRRMLRTTEQRKDAGGFKVNIITRPGLGVATK